MDHSEILKAARQQIQHAQEAPALAPGTFGAPHPNVQAALALLEKFGPSIVNAVIPIAATAATTAGVNPLVVNAVVTIVNALAAGGGTHPTS